MQVQEYLDAINGITLKAQAEIRTKTSWALEWDQKDKRYEENMKNAIFGIKQIAEQALVDIKQFHRDNENTRYLDYSESEMDANTLNIRKKSLLKRLEAIADIDIDSASETRKRLPGYHKFGTISEENVSGVWYTPSKMNIGTLRKIIQYLDIVDLELIADISGRQLLNQDYRDSLARQKARDGRKRRRLLEEEAVKKREEKKAEDRQLWAIAQKRIAERKAQAEREQAGQSNQPPSKPPSKKRKSQSKSQRPSNKPKKTALHLKF